MSSPPLTTAPAPGLRRRCLSAALAAAFGGACAALPAQIFPAATNDTVFACAGEQVTLAAPEGFPGYVWSERGGRNLSGGAELRVRARGTRTYVVASRPSTGPNLAANPAFDEGPGVGFETEYTPRADVIEFPGEYIIAERPEAVNPDFSFCFDADRGTSARVMMLLLTDPDPGRLVYRQRVRVPADSTYLASVTAIHVSAAPARLRVDVNGERGVGFLTVETGPCASDQVNVETRPDATGHVEIAVYSVGPAAGGLGVDGVVVALRPPPRLDTVTVVALGEDATRLTPGLCPGDTYSAPDGRVVAPGDSLVLELKNRGGCDSVVTIVPRALGGAPDTLATRRICAGASTEVFGEVVRADTVVCAGFTTAAGCDSVACVPVAVFERDDIAADLSPDACRAGPSGGIRLRLPPGGRPYVVSWDGAPASAADTMRAGLTAGTYRLDVTDGAGCSARVEAIVAEAPPLAWGDFAVSLGPCDEGEGRGARLTLVDGAGDYGLEVISPDGSSVPNPVRGDSARVPLPTAGTWRLRATDGGGCVLDTAVLVATAPAPTIDGPAALLPGDAVTLTLLGLEAYAGTVTWTLPGRPATVLPLGVPLVDTAAGAGLVRADVLLDDGCALSATLELGQRAVRLYPTAVSPDGDGVNDRFAPLPNAGVERVLGLRVYDRWGGLRYAVEGCGGGPADCSWDVGADDGAGAYVYVARALLTDGREVRVVGEVTVLR